MPPQNLASVSDSGLHGNVDLPKFPAAPYQEDEDDEAEDGTQHTDMEKFRAWASSRARQVCSKETLMGTLPILTWLPKYSRADLMGDIIAGLTVGLTVIPQGIAYGNLALLPATVGLYSSFIGCIVYCFFGSQRAITIGPTAIMALMTSEYGFHGNPDIATLLAFLSGCVILGAGIFQLGFLVDFMSGPVISGFTSAAAITIAVSQLKGLFGIHVDGDGFIETISEIIHKINHTNTNDLILGLCCIAFLISLRETKRLPIMKRKESELSRSMSVLRGIIRFSSIARNAITVAIAAAITAILKYHGNSPFTPVSSADAGLPKPEPPPFSTNDNGTALDFGDMTSHIGVGIGIVPLLAIVENTAIGKAFAEGQRLDVTQEMIALGLSNILGSFFHAMPVTGSFSRTAVNNSSGVRTPLGGVFTAVLVILALQFLTPYFVYIPKSTLSAVIISAVIYMIEFSVLKPMWQSKKLDFIPFLGTLLAGIFWGLEYGIGIGTALSLGMILFKAARPKVVVQNRMLSDGVQEYIYVYPDSGLTYPAAEHVRAVVTDAAVFHGRSTEPVVLDFNNVRYSDFTSAECMNQLVKEFHERHQTLVFVGMKRSIRNCWDGAPHSEGRLSCATIADAELIIADVVRTKDKVDVHISSC